MFDALSFYRDFGVDFADRGNKHARRGWVQIHCPFCTGSRNYHLGYNTNSGAYTCYRCGTKGQVAVIQRLTGLDWKAAKKVHEQYGGDSNALVPSAPTPKPRKRKGRRSISLPKSAGELTARHEAYLRERDFEPEKMKRLYGLKGTAHLGRYSWRIIAPIYLHGRIISYQGRDITGKSDMKYKACPQTEESRDHQTTLYSVDLVPGRKAVVVEGITDQWRLGPGAVAAFGTSYTQAQINMMARRFRRVFLFFDPDDENAAQMSEEMAYALSALRVEVEVLDMDEGTDPGDMAQDDADALMRELGFRR